MRKIIQSRLHITKMWINGFCKFLFDNALIDLMCINCKFWSFPRDTSSMHKFYAIEAWRLNIMPHLTSLPIKVHCNCAIDSAIPDLCHFCCKEYHFYYRKITVLSATFFRVVFLSLNTQCIGHIEIYWLRVQPSKSDNPYPKLWKLFKSSQFRKKAALKKWWTWTCRTEVQESPSILWGHAVGTKLETPAFKLATQPHRGQNTGSTNNEQLLRQATIMFLALFVIHVIFDYCVKSVIFCLWFVVVWSRILQTSLKLYQSTANLL